MSGPKNGFSKNGYRSMKKKIVLIADSGSTKTEWCLLKGKQERRIMTQGISPYFQTSAQISEVLEKELLKELEESASVQEIYFYGTGCANPANARLVKKAIRGAFPGAEVNVTHDLMGAARALCGHEKGIACILGTGSNSCYYNGKSIVRNNPGLGFILGDEGSGAWLGKKVVQYYLYNTFDAELMARFEEKFNTSKDEILDSVYKKPLPNRYLASFAFFLRENRGHYMIENIIEDGFNEFFFNHIYKYRESWTTPVHFAGTVAWLYKDVLQELCDLFELELGKVLRTPMEGLIEYHN